MSRAIDIETKRKIYSVFKYYKTKKLENSEEHRNINVHKVVAMVTGVSSKTVERIAKEGKNLPIEGEFPPTIRINKKRIKKKTIRLEEIGESLIRNRITQIYAAEKDIPTVNEVRKVLKEEGILKCGYEYMRLLLHKMGFELRKKYTAASPKNKNVEFVECKQEIFLSPEHNEVDVERELSDIKTEVQSDMMIVPLMTLTVKMNLASINIIFETKNSIIKAMKA